MYQAVLRCITIVVGTISMSTSLPEWSNQRFVFTVYDVNQTWNEAREICRNNGQLLLSMEDRNAWSLWKLLLIPTESLPRRHHGLRYWMDVHARDPNNRTELYHDNCSRVTYLEWEVNRPAYVMDYPCALFDVYWVPFKASVYKYWIGQPCPEKHYFVCIKLMDELPCVQSCDESVYMRPQSDAECQALCGNLGSGCSHRYLTLDDFTVCHIIKSSVVSTDPYYNICYFPDLYAGLTFCNPKGSYNLSYTPNDQAFVTDLCAEPDTTQRITTTIEETTKQQTTQPNLCECPCSIVTNLTVSDVTLVEKINRLKKELSVNKKNTSAHRRSKISVADHRVSATSIGSMGVVILSIVLGSICLMDLTRVKCDKINKKCFKRKTKRISGGNEKNDTPDIMLKKLASTPTQSGTNQVKLASTPTQSGTNQVDLYQ
ncbi:uncharacterized protein LOC130049954 [Ostrea edulis]|uniref:uncharacterized protein LOC130049954 n=1 Tax=Ostrea edulis TaxID=37623 RepID=UPI0024AFF0F7|nr:uncharacterized protein LOC130049954 [Ostrea edulis]